MLIHTTTVCSLLGIGYMHQKHECKNINIFLFKKEKNNVTEFTFKHSGNVRVIVAFGLTGSLTFYFSKSFLTQLSSLKHCNLCILFFHQVTTTLMYSIESKIFDYMGFVIESFDIQWSWTFWILRVLSYSLLVDYLVLLFQYINCNFWDG